MAIPAGYTPIDYVGFTDRGAYANNATYVINDIVDYRGEKWKCKVTNTINVIPGENANWTIWIGAPVNFVERIIAPLEENPATIAYGVGRQIIYDDYLFEVIKQINVGDTLVVYDPLNPSPSANIKLAPPVETQVLAIKAEADATDDMIAPTETNASASSQPYGVGEQLILNNVLYTVTSAIAQNDPLVISGAGQNLVVSDSITEQLADKADSDVMDGALALKANKTDIARIEGANMSKGYAVGEQFYHGGTLYTALKAIANGAAWSSLVEDTDYGESTVNARLKNINDTLDSEITTRSLEIQALANNLSTEVINRQNADTEINNAIAIVENGDTCTHTGGISTGQYVIWKGELYTADKVISVGNTFYTSGGSKNLTKCDNGGFNKINSALTPQYTDISSYCTRQSGAPSDMTISCQLRKVSKMCMLTIKITAVSGFATGETGILFKINTANAGFSFPTNIQVVGIANNSSSFPDFSTGDSSSWSIFSSGDVYVRTQMNGCKAMACTVTFVEGW